MMSTAIQRRKQDCTKPPIKDAQPLPCRALITNAAAHLENAAAPANAAPLENAALQQAEKIRVLRPPHGTEKTPIAPPHGTEPASAVPPHGTIHPCFTSLSVPPHGHHLEEPSVPGFKPCSTEKFSACHHAESSPVLKGKQPSLFTSSAALCYIAGKPRGLGLISPVLENTPKTAVATSTVKRGFVSSKFLGLRIFARRYTVMGEMGLGYSQGCSLSVRTPARLFTCFQHLVHPMRLKTQTVGSLIQTGIQTMTATTKASCRAAPQNRDDLGIADPIQLHADAHNALNMAVFYLRQPDANVAGARRKAIQALSALRGLSLALEG